MPSSKTPGRSRTIAGTRSGRQNQSLALNPTSDESTVFL